MDINDWRSLTTVASMMMFLAIVWWAFSGHRKQAYDEAAQLPFDDDDTVVNMGSKSASHPEK